MPATPLPPLTGTFTHADAQEASEALRLARVARTEVRATLRLVEGRIRQVEAEVRKRGGCPTSKQAKELFLLRRKATFLLVAHAGFRNIIRESVNPGCGAILHLNCMRTCRGDLYCGPRYHEVGAALAFIWFTFGAGITNLDYVTGGQEAINRATAAALANGDDDMQTMMFVAGNTVTNLIDAFSRQLTSRVGLTRSPLSQAVDISAAALSAV